MFDNVLFGMESTFIICCCCLVESDFNLLLKHYYNWGFRQIFTGKHFRWRKLVLYIPKIVKHYLHVWLQYCIVYSKDIKFWWIWILLLLSKPSLDISPIVPGLGAADDPNCPPLPRAEDGAAPDPADWNIFPQYIRWNIFIGIARLFCWGKQKMDVNYCWLLCNVRHIILLPMESGGNFCLMKTNLVKWAISQLYIALRPLFMENGHIYKFTKINWNNKKLHIYNSQMKKYLVWKYLYGL